MILCRAALVGVLFALLLAVIFAADARRCYRRARRERATIADALRRLRAALLERDVPGEGGREREDDQG